MSDKLNGGHCFIITADDYGMCEPVNRAIDACIEAGLVTTTNVMVNMDLKEEAGTLRQRFPQISVGLHWCVTAGRPTLDPAAVPSLVGLDGRFHKLGEFKRRFKQGAISREELRAELENQYRLFVGLCGQPDYWNTHQNSALDFRTFGFFNATALRLGIGKTRSFRRTYVRDKKLKGIRARLVELLKKSVFDVWFGYIIPRSGTRLPDGRMIYFADNQKLDPDNITKNVRWGGKRVVELVVHPATTAENEYFGTISDMRVKEYEMFSSPKTRSLLEANGIKLQNFSCLDV